MAEKTNSMGIERVAPRRHYGRRVLLGLSMVATSGVACANNIESAKFPTVVSITTTTTAPEVTTTITLPAVEPSPEIPQVISKLSPELSVVEDNVETSSPEQVFVTAGNGCAVQFSLEDAGDSTHYWAYRFGPKELVVDENETDHMAGDRLGHAENSYSEGETHLKGEVGQLEAKVFMMEVVHQLCENVKLPSS